MESTIYWLLLIFFRDLAKNENKICPRHFASFQNMISRKNTHEKLWIDKGTESDGTFKKFGKERH